MIQCSRKYGLNFKIPYFISILFRLFRNPHDLQVVYEKKCVKFYEILMDERKQEHIKKSSNCVAFIYLEWTM